MGQHAHIDGYYYSNLTSDYLSCHPLYTTHAYHLQIVVQLSNQKTLASWVLHKFIIDLQTLIYATLVLAQISTHARAAKI